MLLHHSSDAETLFHLWKLRSLDFSNAEISIPICFQPPFPNAWNLHLTHDASSATNNRTTSRFKVSSIHSSIAIRIVILSEENEIIRPMDATENHVQAFARPAEDWQTVRGPRDTWTAVSGDDMTARPASLCDG